MKALLDMTLPELREAMAALGEKPFRAAQVYRWLMECAPFEEMSNLPKALRETLRRTFREGYPDVVERFTSADGTRKYLLALWDGNIIESVVMAYEHGNTACISTQAGCAMGCAFCASCKGGLKRNLTAGEMLGQVLTLNRDMGPGRNITNVVLMGTGEPLANYENTVRFLRLVNAEESLHISLRNISVSTCGLVPQMLRLAEEGLPVTLCLSLHAATEEKRRQIMPIAAKYGLGETIEALGQYQQASGRRVIAEYILLHGFNDGEADADALEGLLRGMKCHVNLIPYNSIGEGAFQSPSKKDIYGFLGKLEQRGLSATVRRSLGQDIAGACGQLRARYMRG